MENNNEITNMEEPICSETPKALHEINPSDPLEYATLLPKIDDRTKKLVHLRNVLEKDPRAVDIKWSIFIAACQSYRYDSVLNPFPPSYIKDGTKDIGSLLKVIEDTPPLSLLLHQIHDPVVCQINNRVIDLLHWVVIVSREPYLKTVEEECFDSVLTRVSCDLPIPKPSYIFQVVSTAKSIPELKWRELSKNYEKVYAYHGSKLENFYSIIRYGLNQHLTKDPLFGNGIYLSSELSVSLLYSPTGYAWGGSKCGSELSCLALCEIIEHPDYVHCRGSKVADSIGGEVPNKYYVVSNNDLIRIRYLLIYSKSNNRKTVHASLFGWFARNKLLSFLIGYGILLLAVGVSNNEGGKYLYKTILNKVGWNS